MCNFKTRSDAPEILDDFELTGNDLRENLRELEKVNTFLGGYSLLTSALKPLVQLKNGPFTLVDVGCGGGDSLRAAAKWAKKNQVNFKGIGVDANETAVLFCKEESRAFSNLHYQKMNVFGEGFEALKGDVFMFNLFLHHFTEKDIVRMLKICKAKNAVILINDLHRSKIAYHLFRLASRAFGFSYISRHDGKLSVKKSFTKSDWQRILAKAGIINYNLTWKWAFRYLVLVPNET